MADLGEQLRRCFQGPVCLMGLGNPDYGDDGLGAVLSDMLKVRLKGPGEAEGRHGIINAGANPERFMSSVPEKGYEHLIFIDAVEFGGAPGSVVFLCSDEMEGRFPQVSTHKMSPALMARCIEDSGRTKAWLLGVQPGSLRPEEGLTGDVKATLEMLEDIICDLWVSGN